MTLDDRVTKLEDAFRLVALTLDEQTSLLRTHSELLREHGVLLHDIVYRLERIEQAIRERGSNGHQP